MNNNVLFNLKNDANKKLIKAEKKEKERLRAINTERIHRWRQRKKLKTAAADYNNQPLFAYFSTSYSFPDHSTISVNCPLSTVILIVTPPPSFFVPLDGPPPLV